MTFFSNAPAKGVINYNWTINGPDINNYITSGDNNSLIKWINWTSSYVSGIKNYITVILSLEYEVDGEDPVELGKSSIQIEVTRP